MEEKDRTSLRDVFLEALEAALRAQLRAVRQLRRGATEPAAGPRRRGRSQLDYVEDILRRAGSELHITEIIDRVARTHKVQIDRESLVSALSKRVERADRFVRTAPNTFALR